MKSSRAKKFLSLVLAVVMVLALAACGNKTNDDSNTNNDNNSATDFPTKPMTIVCPYGADVESGIWSVGAFLSLDGGAERSCRRLHAGYLLRGPHYPASAGSGSRRDHP